MFEERTSMFLTFEKLMIFKFSFVAFLLVLVLLCTYFPVQCYHNLDIDRSMYRD